MSPNWNLKEYDYNSGGRKRPSKFIGVQKGQAHCTALGTARKRFPVVEHVYIGLSPRFDVLFKNLTSVFISNFNCVVLSIVENVPLLQKQV